MFAIKIRSQVYTLSGLGITAGKRTMPSQKWVLSSQNYCWMTGHFVWSFTLLKNLIQSFRLSIIGVRKEKREKRYDQTKNFKLSLSIPWKTVSENRLHALCHAPTRRKLVTSHLLRACFFIRNFFFLFLLRFVPLQFHWFLSIFKQFIWSDWPQISMFTWRMIRS